MSYPEIWSCTHVCHRRLRFDSIVFPIVRSNVATSFFTVFDSGHHCPVFVWSIHGPSARGILHSRIVWNCRRGIPWWHCDLSCLVFFVSVFVCSWVSFHGKSGRELIYLHIVHGISITNRAAVGPSMGGYLMDHWGYSKASTVIFVMQLAMVSQ